MYRRSFDPRQPLVATSTFNDVMAGDVFDWRARGMTEIEVTPMFASGLLDHSDARPVDAALDELHKLTVEAGLYEASTPPAETVTLTVTPGESVAVQPPKPKKR